MRYKEAYETYQGNLCLFNYDKGVYYCNEVVIERGEKGKRWIARGKIISVARLPFGSTPPLKERCVITATSSSIDVVNNSLTLSYKDDVFKLLEQEQLTLFNYLELSKEEENTQLRFQQCVKYRLRLNELDLMRGRFARRFNKDTFC